MLKGGVVIARVYPSGSGADHLRPARGAAGAGLVHDDQPLPDDRLGVLVEHPLRGVRPAARVEGHDELHRPAGYPAGLAGADSPARPSAGHNTAMVKHIPMT